MINGLKLSALFLVSLAVTAAHCAAHAESSDQIQAKIEDAYKIRTSDRERFSKLLDELVTDEADATPEQVENISYLKAFNLNIIGKNEEGLNLAGELLASARTLDVRVRSGALISNVAALRRDYLFGLRTMQKTLDLLGPDLSVDVLNQVWGAAATLYSESGQSDLALQYIDKVIEKPASARALCSANVVRSDLLLKQVRLDDFKRQVSAAIEQCQAINEDIHVNALRVMLGDFYLKKGLYDEGAALLSKHIEEVEALHFAGLIVRFKVVLADLLLKKGDDGAAEGLSLEAVRNGGYEARSLDIVRAYEILYRIAEGRRDHEQALVYYRRYAVANQEYLSEVHAREMAYQTVMQEAEQNALRVKQLGSQNDLLQLQREVEKKAAQNSRLIIVLLILVLGGVGLWAVRTKRVHKKLREMAETDALTGVCNRHHFTNQAERSLAMCAGAGEEVALVMFDLDHFKAVNDQYGHAVGDWVLKHVATTSRTFCRRVDTLGRIGGEEFAFLLHGCDLQTAIRLAEDCRARISLIDTIESGYKYTITASFGAASSKVSGYQLTRLLSHADKMLYRAKSLGRNRVCAYDGNTEFDMPAEPLPRTGTVTRISSAHPDAANRSHLSAG